MTFMPIKNRIPCRKLDTKCLRKILYARSNTMHFP